MTTTTVRTQEKSLSNFGRFWQRFRKEYLAILAALFLLFLVVVAIFRDPLMPFSKDEADFFSTYCQPSFMSNEDVITCMNPEPHLFGTDDLGRDAYSRLIYGTRISMQASLLGVAIAIILGLPIGMLSGFIGGRFDRAVMWVVDIIFSLPGILIAFGVIAVLGNGLLNAMIAVGIVLSTRFARLARGVVLAEREELYVDGARVGGLSTNTIIFKHILPNIAPPLIVQTSLLFGAVILIEAGLSFLGVGVPLSEPSWGRMLAESRAVLISNPFLSIPPGLAIALTVLAWNILGDGLRDALGRDISSNQLTTVRRLKTEKSGGSQGDLQGDFGMHNVENTALMLANIDVRFPTPLGGEVTILNDVSFAVESGKTLGIVGESGSGKSMSVMAAMGIVPSPGQVTGGRIYLNENDVTDLSEGELHKIRGKEIAMIFQEPIASLNPSLTVGQQLIQPIQLHLGLSQSDAWEKATELLRVVQVPDPERRMNEYPHQFSGGMAQRVGIARALSCDPEVLIADEPTTALDVTVQGQVIDLLRDLQAQLGLAIVFITHDLGVIAEIADNVAVMYAGEVVETGPISEVFTQPQHPYTKALLETLPHNGRQQGKLPVIDGMVPPPNAWPSGCRFHPRCQFATEVCTSGTQEMRQVGDEHETRCVRVSEIELVAV
ncbi:MAG: dipeptide/oligopeptide/nickel ABC transporter permease/ATP-binding protein [Chloroflexota bacterium]